jgi:hypothetical protein
MQPFWETVEGTRLGRLWVEVDVVRIEGTWLRLVNHLRETGTYQEDRTTRTLQLAQKPYLAQKRLFPQVPELTEIRLPKSRRAIAHM